MRKLFWNLRPVLRRPVLLRGEEATYDYDGTDREYHMIIKMLESDQKDMV